MSGSGIPTFPPRLNILPSAQRTLWPDLAPLSDLGYVLYGGTAIALRLGHRVSVDFDFFSDRPLDKPTLIAAQPVLAHSTVLQDSPNTLTVLTSIPPNGEVKLSIFGGIGFGRVGTSALTSDGVAQVASLDDLMATKLKVLLQRVEAKDYRDVAALLRQGVLLDRGLASARVLFGSAFQPSECLKALVYFQGGDLETLSSDEQQSLISAAAAVGSLPEVIRLSHSLAFSSDPL